MLNSEMDLASIADDIAREIEMDPLLQRQFDLEAGMVEEGKRLFNERLQKLRVRFDDMMNQKTVARESQSIAARSLIKVAVEPVAAHIVKWLAEIAARKAGRHGMAVKQLRLVDPEVAAFIALRVMFDTFSTSPSLTNTCVLIGKAVEDECRIGQFAKAYPALYRGIQKRFKSHSTKHHRKVLTAAIRRADGEDNLVSAEWTKTEALQVGAQLVTAVIEATGYFELATVTAGRGVGHGSREKCIIRPVDGTADFVAQKHEFAQYLMPTYGPTVIPPKPWTTPTDGGYHYSLARKYRLVKNRDRDYQGKLKATDMPTVYAAINALQDTAWQVNRDVFALMNECAMGGSILAGLPDGRTEDVPDCPTDIPKAKEQRTPEQEARLSKWKSLAHGIYERNVEAQQKGMVLARTLVIAERHLDDEAIYFPHVLDFRGRAYPVPMFLNPQGCDWQKALLRFSEGKALGEGGAWWLAVHGANLMAECPMTKAKLDKGPLQDRVDWVLANEQRIRDAAAAPLADLWWTQADSPWCFLAFCNEWVGYLNEGVGFRSHLPVALDGSCNGIQNFSAALRDEVGGAAVNLVPSDKPSDIYSLVLAKVLAALQGMTRGDDEEAGAMADKWLASGQVDRTLCKRPVMTMPYGSKQFGIKDQIMQELKKRGFKFPDSRDNFAECHFIAAVIWKAIGEVVIKAREAMDWLQSVARVATSEGQALSWTAPSGFPVFQRYNDIASKQVKTIICGSLIKPRIAEETEELARHRQTNGVAPNFVHSMDSSHMAMTVDIALANGVDAFAMIHDSFGTHAADTTRFWKCLRIAFVEMYESHDVLSEFVAEVSTRLTDEAIASLPAMPAFGTLDISKVEESDYFFA